MALMDSIIKFNRIHLAGGGFDGHHGSDRYKALGRLKQSEIYTLFALRNMLRKKDRSNCEGIKVTELSSALRVSPPTVSQTIQVLTREGYVKRQRSELDRRSVLLSITKEGQELCETLHNRLLERCKHLTDYLGKEDSLQLANLLSRTFNFFCEYHNQKEHK